MLIRKSEPARGSQTDPLPRGWERQCQVQACLSLMKCSWLSGSGEPHSHSLYLPRQQTQPHTGTVYSSWTKHAHLNGVNATKLKIGFFFIFNNMNSYALLNLYAVPIWVMWYSIWMHYFQVLPSNKMVYLNIRHLSLNRMLGGSRPALAFSFNSMGEMPNCQTHFKV